VSSDRYLDKRHRQRTGRENYLKSTGLLAGALILCVILIVVLFFRVLDLENRVRGFGEPNGGGITALQESLKRVQAELAAAKELGPGLGEYMTTIQLHTAKLWFAAKASNWELAAYELHELEETMEAVKKLNVEKNGVKITGVMDAVLQTQIAQLEESIKRKNQTEFQKSYDETLSACNGCHTESGHKYIQLIRPTAPPVTNQKWEMSAD
jgi:hypothetical protein